MLLPSYNLAPHSAMKEPTLSFFTCWSLSLCEMMSQRPRRDFPLLVETSRFSRLLQNVSSTDRPLVRTQVIRLVQPMEEIWDYHLPGLIPLLWQTGGPWALGKGAQGLELCLAHLCFPHFGRVFGKAIYSAFHGLEQELLNGTSRTLVFVMAYLLVILLGTQKAGTAAMFRLLSEATEKQELVGRTQSWEFWDQSSWGSGPVFWVPGSRRWRGCRPGFISVAVVKCPYTNSLGERAYLIYNYSSRLVTVRMPRHGCETPGHIWRQGQRETNCSHSSNV